jgi:Tfp pilus assembly protein PilF
LRELVASVHYIEAYGAAAGTASVTYEVGRDEQSPALVSAVVAARPIGESRALFSRLLPVSTLPPGRYRLRAVVNVGGAPVGTLSRAFEIAGDASAGGSADAPRTDVVLANGTELFLPIDPGDLRIPFQVADALRSEVLDPFAARVPASVRASFDAGVGHLRNGEFTSAESSFKLAIRPGLDFTAAVRYLAVAFAASGHDAEAAAAWQTALVGGSNLPQIYVWLGDALLRIREFARARTALEEALRRWPADVRFARPLALLDATTGRGYEAILRLQQYLATNDADPGALYLGVQWIYTVHLKRVARLPREIRAVARQITAETAESAETHPYHSLSSACFSMRPDMWPPTAPCCQVPE